MPISALDNDINTTVNDKMNLSIRVYGEIATVPPNYDILMTLHRSRVADFNSAVKRASNYSDGQYNSAAGEGEYIHSLFYGIIYGYAKQNTVPNDFIGPLAVNQNYNETVNITTFYSNTVI